jgi:hypothetical protein
MGLVGELFTASVISPRICVPEFPSVFPSAGALTAGANLSFERLDINEKLREETKRNRKNEINTFVQFRSC